MKRIHQFKLGGRTWRVRYMKSKGTCYGKCISDKCLIKVYRHKTREAEMHTLCHEIGHAFGFTMGWKKLIRDEDTVDALGGLLAQLMTTMVID